MKTKHQIASSFLLLLTALIWGVAFVAQSVGMDYIGPFTFGGIRFLIGCVCLLPLIFFRRNTLPKNRKAWLQLFKYSFFCGMALFVASSLQQIGIMYTTVGKSGFITAMYIVLVPTFGLFLGKRLSLKLLISIIAAVAGLYLLCVTDSITNLNFGDCLMFTCAICYTVHILIIDFLSLRVDGVQFSCLQFFFAGCFSLLAMCLTETPQLDNVIACLKPLLYVGCLSTGVGYTLQIIAQKNLEPTLASLLMSMESVFSVLAGWLILHQSLSSQELCGCGLMFFAIILANLQQGKTSS